MSEIGEHVAIVPSAVYDRTLLGRIDRRILDRPAVRWILLLLFTATFVAASVKFVRNIHTVEDSEVRGHKRKTALGRWLADPRALVEGQDPYGPGHWFPNPPLVLMALTPLAYLPLTATAAVWLLAKFVAVIAAAGCMLGAVRRRELGVPIGVLLMAGVFGLRPILGDVQHGNINIFVLCEVAVVWWLFVRGRDGWAGVVLALAITTKVTPALLLVYFAYKRAWRVVLVALLWLVLFVVVLPGGVLGFDRNFELLGGWFDLMVRPYVLEGWITVQTINQSLPGTLMKWMAAPEIVAHNWPQVSLGAAGVVMERWLPVELTSDVATRFRGSAFLDLFYQAWHSARLAAVPLQSGMPFMGRPEGWLGAALIRGAGLVVLAALAWLCRTPLGDRRDPRLLLELSLVLLAMLLLSERTWKHHMVTLLIVYLATWQVLTCYPWSRRLRAAFVGGLVLQFIMLQVRGDILLFIGCITAAMGLAFVQNAWLLRRLRVPRMEGQE